MTLCAPFRPSWEIVRRRPGLGRERPLLTGELFVVLALVKVYDAVRSLAATRERTALEHGRAIVSLESHLHIDVERTVNHWLTSSGLLTEIAAGWYQFAHLSVTLAVLAGCYRWRPDIYRRARSSLVLVNLVGLAVFWLYPVAPPRMLPRLGFVDTDMMAGYGHGPAGPVTADVFAAMPSLHLAWATWTVIVAIKLLRNHPWLQRLAPGYAVITSLVVLATANHYILDVIAGITVGLVASRVTGLLSSAPDLPVEDSSELPAAGSNGVHRDQGDGDLGIQLPVDDPVDDPGDLVVGLTGQLIGEREAERAESAQ